MDTIKLGVVLAQMINFGILVAIFYFAIGKKFIENLHERKRQLFMLEQSDFQVQQKLAQAEKEAESILLEARKKAIEIEKNAQDIASKELQKKILEAEEESRSIKQCALRDIEREYNEMRKELKMLILQTSLEINKKLFENHEKNVDFIKKQVDSLKL